MADIVTFVPRREIDAESNLKGFIELCKTQLTTFGADLKFDENVWDVSNSISTKARYNSVRMVFSTHASANDRVPVMMAEPYGSFAKAYMRYQQSMRPTKSYGSRIAALRALEAALAENGRGNNPVQIDTHVMNRSAQLIKEHFTEVTAYRVGGQLEMISDFLCDSRLTIVSTRWLNSIRRPSDAVRVGKAFDECRAAKMPSEAVLDALPKVFLRATTPADRIVSSIAAILCSAPDRINEVLTLPVHCEIRQKGRGSEAEAYGLRWWPAKGAEPMVKWLVPSMKSVVMDAITRIQAITDDARALAKWYEVNPRKIFLPEHLEYLRDQKWLSMQDLGSILFVGTPYKSTANHWCRGKKIAMERRGGFAYVLFSDVEENVLKMLPRGFPILSKDTGLKYSEALCVVNSNLLNESKVTYRCVMEAVSQLHISNRFGARSKRGVQSIFDRAGLFEPDGNPIRVSSHQFRHYLNTLAQSGGMSQFDIAKWSGRKDVRQNDAYDHVSSQELVAQIRAAVGDDKRMFGPLAELPKSVLIPRDEFARLKVPTAHTTDFGYCIHDFVMSPCQIHRDCLNCDEQVCVKGDHVKEARIRLAHKEAAELLAGAELAASENGLGANRWVEHQRIAVARLDNLCAILDDPAVPKGAFIQLTPPILASRVAHARAALAESSQSVLIPSGLDNVEDAPK